MKTLFSLLMILTTTLTANAQHNHPPHDMIILGKTGEKNEVIISHLVYKSPHNFQVEMKVTLPNEASSAYFNQIHEFQNDTFLYRLTDVHIGGIKEAQEITGSLIREDAEGNRTTILEKVTVPKSDYKILYFYELPLNL